MFALWQGATQKVDSIIAENPGKTLDELLDSRKINGDQKAQAEKKPALKATLNQLEEQLEHYKKFDEDYQKKFAAEKASLDAAHAEELEKVKESASVETMTEVQSTTKEKLLVLSRFLRAAAAKRQDGDETAEENRAFEGALLLIYGGDSSAVEAMEKLIDGSEDLVPTVEGQPSSFTCRSSSLVLLWILTDLSLDKHVRDASAENGPASYAAEEAWAENAPAEAESAAAPPAEDVPVPPQADATLTNAGMTELDDGPMASLNGGDHSKESTAAPDASTVDTGAANAVAEANWEAKLSQSQSVTSGPDAWVEVPRDPAETETGLDATPAAFTSTQSWAEDVPTEGAPATPATSNTNNDGFHEVHHNRGRGRSHGEHRGGNRGRGGYRGDRGEGYRGRGGYRSDRGGEGYRGRGRGPRGRGRGDAVQ